MFLPGTCWIQWRCLNSALRPMRARAEPGQPLAHFPHRSSAMWRWGRLNKAALKKVCPPFPGRQLVPVPVPSSAGSWLGRERSGSDPGHPRDADMHTQTHTCACRYTHGHGGYSAQPEQSLPGGSLAPAPSHPLLPPRWRWPQPPPLPAPAARPSRPGHGVSHGGGPFHLRRPRPAPTAQGGRAGAMLKLRCRRRPAPHRRPPWGAAPAGCGRRRPRAGR